MLGFGRVRPLKILALASGQRQADPAGFNSVRKALPLPPLVAWTGFKVGKSGEELLPALTGYWFACDMHGYARRTYGYRLDGTQEDSQAHRYPLAEREDSRGGVTLNNYRDGNWKFYGHDGKKTEERQYSLGNYSSSSIYH